MAFFYTLLDCVYIALGIGGIALRQFDPEGLLGLHSESCTSLSESLPKLVGLIVKLARIDHGPLVLLKLNRLKMTESAALVLLPCASVALLVKYLDWWKHFPEYFGEIRINLNLPVV